MDKIFATEFQAETAQLIDSIEVKTIALERSPDDTALIHQIKQGWKRLKSLATLFEISPVSDLSFQFEELFSLLLKKELDPDDEVVNALLAGLDQTKALVEACIYDQPERDEEMYQFIESIPRQFGLTPLPRGQNKSPQTQAGKEQRIITGEILIIEDEPVNRMFLEESLRMCSKHLNITSVDSAAEGLYYYFTNKYDLVFLDIMMPIVDGNHFISIIEKNHQAGHLQFIANIVVQTAIQSIAQLTSLAKKECVQEIIRKPITPKRVKDCINRYCLQTAAK